MRTVLELEAVAVPEAARPVVAGQGELADSQQQPGCGWVPVHAVLAFRRPRFAPEPHHHPRTKPNRNQRPPQQQHHHPEFFPLQIKIRIKENKTINIPSPQHQPTFRNACCRASRVADGHQSANCNPRQGLKNNFRLGISTIMRTLAKWER